MSRRKSSFKHVILWLLPILGACQADRYNGIDLRTAGGDASLRALAVAARTGDKAAQLALGIRFEHGLGVSQSDARAIKLYRLAARPSSGNIWVYSPPVRKGGAGRVIPVSTGSPQKGLQEAQERLAAIRMRRP